MNKKQMRRIIVSGVFVLVLYGMIFCFFPPEDSMEKKPLIAEKVVDEENSEATEFEFEEFDGKKDTTEQMNFYEDDSPEIKLVMVGDMLMHTRVVNSGKQEDGGYNFDHLFQEVGKDIQKADLALVNQETILGGEELGISSYPCFNSPYEVGDAEAKTGFDVILQATNHALDVGAQGILNDIYFWENRYPYISCLGIYDSQEDQDNDIFVYEKDGIKISILNYTYGTNGIELPSGMPFAVNYMKKEQMKRDIAKAKSMSDFVIVCPHWGTEYRLTEDESQKKWTQFFLEEGVNLVIGAHPHVIEPVKWVRNDAGQEMLVYYSLGNFVNGTENTDGSPADRMIGGMAEVTIGYNEYGAVSVLDYGVEPIVCHMAEGSEYTVYYLKDYTEELAQKNIAKTLDADFSLEYCNNLVNQVWGVE